MKCFGGFWLCASDPMNLFPPNFFHLLSKIFLKNVINFFTSSLSPMIHKESLLFFSDWIKRSGKVFFRNSGTQGTFAETPSVPFQKTDLTIAVWIFIESPLTKRQEVYSDWSSPRQFRIDIEINDRLCFQGRRDVRGVSDMMTPCTQSGWVQFFCHDQRGGDFPLRKLTVRVMQHLNDSCANFGPEMQLQL